jgi:C4-type Zn-finger protein
MRDAQPESQLKKAEIKLQKNFDAEMESHKCPICLNKCCLLTTRHDSLPMRPNLLVTKTYCEAMSWGKS